ncbi:MAG: tetratricopeptide repeat protein [Verrucomicrobiia bacterium]
MNTSMSPILPVVLLILVGVLLWRLRKRERNYPPAERANKISEALREGRDVRIVYWSKSRKRFVREIVTPESLDGLYMKALDHARGVTRRFKITRIKEIVVFPHPALGSALIPQESQRNVHVMIVVLLLVVVALVYWLHYDVERNDFTFRTPEPATVGVGSARTGHALSNAFPSQAEDKGLSGKVSGPVTNRSDASLLESKLKNSRGFYEQAFALNAGGDLRGVIEYCTKAIESDPYYAQAYCLRALARVVKGDFNGAITDSTKAIKLSPRYSQAYYIRGGARDERGESEAAIADYTEAIQINPQFSDAYNARAWAQYRRGDLEKAIEDVNQAILLNPRSANAYDTRGWTKYGKGDKDGALADCSRAVQLDPQSAVGYNSQGLLQYIVGDYRDAVLSWNKVIEMAPSSKSHLQPWIQKARDHPAK